MKRLLSVAVLVALLFTTHSCNRRESRSVTPRFTGAPVILISIDTLRADHLPMFGYRNVETPNLDALRRDSILYRNAFSHVPLTLPSHVSILTGLLPPANEVRNNIGYRFEASKHPTIAATLAKSGYATGAAVSAYVLRGATGLSADFQFYDDAIEVKGGEAVGQLQRAGGETAAIAKRWIGERGDKPFFFFLHLFEPHTPYTPPEPFKSRFALPYDGEIAAADAIVGDFIAYLRSAGIYDRAVIILLSDHGEGLMDHGEDEHGIFLYREEIHVPLLVKLPKSQFAGETVDAAAQLTDVAPTIAQLVGVEPPQGTKGESLLSLRANAPARAIYSETLYPRIHLGWSALRSLTDGGDHYIEAPSPELYDMQRDPGERQNVITEKRRQYNALKSALATYDAPEQLPTHIDPEEARKLAALGYIGSAAAPAEGPLPDPKSRIGEIVDMKEAARLSARGAFEAAAAKLRGVLQSNPRLTDAWTLYGEALEGAGRYEEAVEAYKQCIKASPTLAPSMALRIASLDLDLHKYDEARAHAELAVSSTPGDASLMLARIALARGDLPAARRHLQTPGASAPAAAAGVVSAQIDVAAGDLVRALATTSHLHYEVSAGRLPPTQSLEMTRGDALARLDRRDDAIAAFSEEIRRFPRHREAYAHLALVYLLGGDAQRAEATLASLVDAVPGPASLRFATQTVDAFAGLLPPPTQARWRRELAARAGGRG